jgi:hypothetical protein
MPAIREGKRPVYRPIAPLRDLWVDHHGSIAAIQPSAPPAAPAIKAKADMAHAEKNFAASASGIEGTDILMNSGNPLSDSFDVFPC